MANHPFIMGSLNMYNEGRNPPFNQLVNHRASLLTVPRDFHGFASPAIPDKLRPR